MITQTRCCIAGGGPAGMMAGLLLARRGVDVVVLEKHADFLRDFRGDTIHPSTIEVMDELGLLDRLMALPHTKIETVSVETREGVVHMADFRRLHTRFPFLMLVPQWDFLELLADAAAKLPHFRLRMRTEAKQLLRDGDIVRGVRLGDGDEIHALLTLAADGRASVLREQSRLPLVQMSVPMDALWLRLPRKPSDPPDLFFREGRDLVRLLGFINRGDYWQLAAIIRAGDDARVRAEGLPRFKQLLREIAPMLSDRVEALRSLDEVKTLRVQANRLTRWHMPGFLCIGDAAHAMSPVGGVGINLAIQDAVATDNLVGDALVSGQVIEAELHRVQRRRELPTRVTQAVQRFFERRFLAKIADPDAPLIAPLARRLLSLPFMQGIPARLVGIGVRPEHVHAPAHSAA